jgi:MFS family permease
VGCYAVYSSTQSLRLQDRPTYTLTWGNSAFVYAVIGFSCIALLNAVVGFWATPLALRRFDIDKATVGLILGSTWAVCGVFGVVLGGRMSDFFLRRSPIGRLGMGVVAATVVAPFVATMCFTTNPVVFFLCDIPVVLFGISWVPSAAATVQDLVLPRMRGTAAATYFIGLTIISLGLGPYLIGKASVVTGDLGLGLLCVLLVIPISLLCFFRAAKTYQHAEASKLDRAIRAGEHVA